MLKRTVLGASVTILMLASWSCSKDYILDLGAESFPGAGTWLINESYVQWGCPGKDCIPNLTNPRMVKSGSSELAFLDDNELVVGVKKGDDYYAFPHSVLDWHEVVNMEEYTISYCPLTGSAIHIIDDRGFGVSGLLYNSNLIMYDKESTSYWPQMFLRSAAGKFRGEKLELGAMIETKWATWKKLFPETYVVSSQTGYPRNYNAYPYGSYRTDGSVYFPIESFDEDLHPKERVIGVLMDNTAKAYSLSSFDTLSVLHDTVEDQNIVIFASSADDFAVLFKTEKQFSVKTYNLEEGEAVFTDEATGSEWNILGEAISGPLQGEILDYGDSFICYWFSWTAFYPKAQLWVGE
ncbi:MAG: DUF3179 domain-containing protein [Candidatus Neomarinimicrobiota bacterium]